MQAEGGEFEFALKGSAVEGFDIYQFVLEAIAAGIDFVLGQGIEHEGVVGIGAMPHADELAGGGGSHKKSLEIVRRPNLRPWA